MTQAQINTAIVNPVHADQLAALKDYKAAADLANTDAHYTDLEVVAKRVA